MKGDFEALLTAGQRSVAALDGRFARVLNHARVSVDRAGDRLIVTVDDPETLRLLLSERPSTAEFRTRLPGQKDAAVRETFIRYE